MPSMRMRPDSGRADLERLVGLGGLWVYDSLVARSDNANVLLPEPVDGQRYNDNKGPYSLRQTSAANDGCIGSCFDS